jgi:hypothetical protein
MKHQWKTFPKNDRLKRWQILGFSEGRGKPVIADNIRSEDFANLIAAAPDMYEALEEVINRMKIHHGYEGEMSIIKTVLAKARGETL